MFYRQMGMIPKKRHTQFRKEDGTLFREQVMGTKGFSGVQSILYHHHMPTEIAEASIYKKCAIEYEEDSALRHRHFRTAAFQEKGDVVQGRHYLLGNDDLLISVVHPTEPMDYYYRNGDADEMFFVHYGSGTLETMFGNITYQQGDYVYIPIGTIYRVIPNEGESKFLVIESNSEITTPRRYRNEYGQLLEHSPFCERDFRTPEMLVSHEEKGKYTVLTKSRQYLHKHVFNHHPFDVVGWDGHLYPWAFNIADFEPITGRIHQPPPVHQTFEGHNFVICSFVPRLYDYHPEAIPAPYYHSNVNSDEVLYYVKGNFMSRKGVEIGSVTLHPSGIPHGPHPGKTEGSIGKKETLELAVMIDTFRPLRAVKGVSLLEDEQYMYGWVEGKA